MQEQALSSCPFLSTKVLFFAPSYPLKTRYQLRIINKKQSFKNILSKNKGHYSLDWKNTFLNPVIGAL